MEAHTEVQAPDVADGFGNLRPSSSDNRQRPILNADLANTCDELVIVGYVSAFRREDTNLRDLHRSVRRLDLEIITHISL